MTVRKSGDPKVKASFAKKPSWLVYPVVITREPRKCWYCAKKWGPGHTCKQSKVLNIMVMEPNDSDKGELNLDVEDEDDPREKEDELQQSQPEEELLHFSL